MADKPLVSDLVSFYFSLFRQGGGILCGHYLQKYFRMKEYKWESVAKIASPGGFLKRFIMQWTPVRWVSFEWGYAETWERFVLVNFMLIAAQLLDLGHFYIKVPPFLPLPLTDRCHRSCVLYVLV